MKLVIVESPAKAKTIAKYLGKDYAVDASGGHVRDLPVKSIGVNIANNYEPLYEVNSDKKDTIKRLKSKVAEADEVFLATDPDREGEAISWHLQYCLKLPKNQKNRITFNEISKKAVQAAMEKPDYINQNLVNAQQARRVLDRLVGYKLSPVLCKKIQPKLSAGRVQSAALKIIVDREREIKAFVPEEYWIISAVLEKPKNPPKFTALLASKNDKKIKIHTQEECDKVLSELNGNDYVVSAVKKSITTSSPFAPFTTSTMQQDAVNKLRMGSAKCMQVAQQLYEGLDVDNEHIALVTYIRTDSTRVSTEAHVAARAYIEETYGKEYVPEKFNVYASKKGAQDAHEAIRPINVRITPESLTGKITPDQLKLYKLIYERFLASCAEKARYDSVAVTISCGEYQFKANGKTQLFDGYTRIYSYNRIETDDEDKGNEKLPDLAVDDKLKLHKLNHEQKFTKVPPRYTESSIIKCMDENGIGRPSTYAAILSNLYKRTYVVKVQKALEPTALGFAVCEYLEKYFDDIVNIEFTAQMEDKLDTIEDNADVNWTDVVDGYFKPLEGKIKTAMAGEIALIAGEKTDEKCPQCGAILEIKMGRFGKYYRCPTCEYSCSLKNMNKVPPKPTDIKCEKCGGVMVERQSKYGKFLACANYPKCKNTVSVSEKTIKCPKCGGNVVKRFTKRNKLFFGCSNYPKCDFSSWDEPTEDLCPKCGAVLFRKEAKDKVQVFCKNQECDYKKEEQN